MQFSNYYKSSSGVGRQPSLSRRQPYAPPSAGMPHGQPHGGGGGGFFAPSAYYPAGAAADAAAAHRNGIEYRRIDLFGANYQHNNRAYFTPSTRASVQAAGATDSAFPASAVSFTGPSSAVDEIAVEYDADVSFRAGGGGQTSAHATPLTPPTAEPTPEDAEFYYHYFDTERELEELERSRRRSTRQRRRRDTTQRPSSRRSSRSTKAKLRQWLLCFPDEGVSRESSPAVTRQSSLISEVSDSSSSSSSASVTLAPVDADHDSRDSGDGRSRTSAAPAHITRVGSGRSNFSEQQHAGADNVSASSAAPALDDSDSVGQDYYVPTWKYQLGAAIQRDTTERLRGWRGLLVELLVPLVCIACTVVLWAAFGDVHQDTDSEPVAVNRNLYLAKPGRYKQYMCYNDTWNGAPNFIEGFPACSVLNASTVLPITCDGSHENAKEIPVQGLCVDASGAGTYSFMMKAVDLAMALPVDDIIAHHWMATKQGVQQSSEATLLISAGFATNNRYSAIGGGGKLFFAPSANVPADMIAYFRGKSKLFDYVYAGTYDTAEAAREVISSHSLGTTWALINVKSLSSRGMDVSVDMNQSVLPVLDRMTDPTYYGGYVRDRADMYLISGFASLQRVLLDYYMQSPYSGLSATVKTEALNFVPFVDSTGSPPYRVGQVLTVASTVLGFVIVLAFLYPVSQTTRRLVVEKERRIHEAMLIMGMKSYWLRVSWFLQCFAFNFVVSLLMTILLCATFIRRSDPFALFLVFFVFSLSTIPLAGMLASFFEKSRMAALLTPLIYFALSVPLFAMQSAPSVAVLVLCILSPTAFAHLLTIALSAESGGGFSIHTLRSEAFSPRGELAMGFLAADFGLYFLLMLYFDAVLPKDVGMPKHPLFFIIDPAKWIARRCCCCCGGGGRGNNSGDAQGDTGGYGAIYGVPSDNVVDGASVAASNFHDDSQWEDSEADYGSPTTADTRSTSESPSRPFPTVVAADDGRDPNGVYEEESIPLYRRSVDVRGLRKQFSRGGRKFLAVANLYWCMPNEGISVLLGHNGAGKSTALNMMTGMLRPDAGDCYVCGVSVRHDLSAARQQIGFCPQHNILWPELTCRQHLEFFAKIKGLRGAALEDAVVQTLEEVDLLDKADYPARALSGGMKRKLSVAIAFVGGSPLVFLDEPTAGMDVAARRHTWELLLRMSRHRSVLLTTHFMDEADLLGDRIAIMSNGRLKCSGSSLFLKSRLGVGYNITMSVQPFASIAVLNNLVARTVNGAEELSYSGCEVTYRLPSSEANSFADLLAAIEDSGAQLGVRGYSLSATTLEEVFLRVAEQDHREADAQREAAWRGRAAAAYDEDEAHGVVAAPPGRKVSPNSSSEESGGRTRESTADSVWMCEVAQSNCAVIGLQFSAMIRKRFYNTKRDSRMLCFQVICPVVCVLIAMILNLVNMAGASTQSFTYDSFLDDRVVMAVSNCSRYFNSSDPGVAAAVSKKLTIEDPNTVDGYDLYYMTLDSWFMHGDAGRYGQVFCDYREVQEKQSVAGRPVVLYHNSSSYHQVAVDLTSFYNMALYGLSNKSASDPTPPPRVQVSTTHLPASSVEKNQQDAVKTILIGLIIMIPFTFLPSNCVSWIVKERECKSRHLQDISGLRFLIYWTTNFVFDIASYLVTLFLVLMIFLIFQRKEYVGTDTVGATIALFVVFGFCSTATAYVIHFAFSEHAAAQLIVMAAGFITGFLLVIIVFILNLLEETQTASQRMRYAFRVIPTFCVGEGIINLAILKQNQVQDPSLHALSMDVTGWPCVYMAAETPIFILLTLIIDHPYWKLLWQRRSYTRHGAPDPASEEDSDVEDERNQVISRLLQQKEQGTHNLNDGLVDDAVSVVLLKKQYENGKVAVKNVTFGVVPGEVFGFLGTNGAGKTTTISILCQEFLPTSGQAIICGYDIIDDRREALQCIGYCPQFDGTLDLLTVEEHLSVFAGIRTIVAEQHDAIIADLMELTGLTEYKSTLAGELSGGNRRKLSVALSLIGGPNVVFLDEPSAGMDPVARRGLWTSIQKVAKKCSIVLTTHHLEEVEALADCVAIMVDGGLRCIGDKTHLKNKYGSGFEMALRIVDVAYHDTVLQYVKDYFPEARLNEFRGQRFVFALPKDVKLSEVFNVLQQTKDQAGISDYSISQTSIEQVFMRISDEAEEAERIRDLLSRRKIAKENAEFIKAEKKRAKEEARRRARQQKRQQQQQQHGKRSGTGGGGGGKKKKKRHSRHDDYDEDEDTVLDFSDSAYSGDDSERSSR